MPRGKYVRSSPADQQDCSVSGSGDHIRNLRCFRAATLLIELQNKPPLDAGWLDIQGPFGAAKLNNQANDTVVALQIFGSTAFMNRISIIRGVRATQYANVSAQADDTVYLQFDF